MFRDVEKLAGRFVANLEKWGDAEQFPKAVYEMVFPGIEKVASEYDLVVTCEEHNIVGGFSSAVAEVMAEMREKKAYLVRIGLNDEYSIKVGNQKYLRAQYGMTGEQIARKIEDTVNG